MLPLFIGLTALVGATGSAIAAVNHSLAALRRAAALHAWATSGASTSRDQLLAEAMKAELEQADHPDDAA